MQYEACMEVLGPSAATNERDRRRAKGWGWHLHTRIWLFGYLNPPGFSSYVTNKFSLLLVSGTCYWQGQPVCITAMLWSDPAPTRALRTHASLSIADSREQDTDSLHAAPARGANCHSRGQWH